MASAVRTEAPNDDAATRPAIRTSDIRNLTPPAPRSVPPPPPPRGQVPPGGRTLRAVPPPPPRASSPPRPASVRPPPPKSPLPPVPQETMRGYALPPVQSGVSRVHPETPAPELARVPDPPRFVAVEPSFVDIPMPEAPVAWPSSGSVEISMDDLAFAKKLQSFDLGNGLTAGFRAFARDVREAVSEKGLLAAGHELRIFRMKAMVTTARALHRIADELETRA